MGSYPTYEEWKQSKYYCIISWFLSSYPTYEEWKLGKLGFSDAYLWVFLSYLRGMETRCIFYVNGVNYSVLILPTRNGNPQGNSRFPQGNSRVLILPTRNGNALYCTAFLSLLHSSYPTYEEWKLQRYLYGVFR